MQHSYRQQFESESSVARYDEDQYALSSWSSVLWEVEKEVLSNLLSEPQFVPNRSTYLDFACGTGRITAFVAPHFEKIYGLDISEAMLQRAVSNLPEITLICANIVAEPLALDAPIDLITSFRFILNADPADRLAALTWMRSRLRNSDSRIVLNNHGSLLSHKAAGAAIVRAKSAFLPRRQRFAGNVMSHTELTRLATKSGLTIDRLAGTGVLGGKSMRLLGPQRSEYLQRRAADIAMLGRLGEDQIYILGLK